jgi:hypothetical protein
MAFIEMKEELDDACDVEDYCRLMAELRRIRDDLCGIAVVQRVKKEVRGLSERLPQLQAQCRIMQQTRMRDRLRQIERNASVLMVIEWSFEKAHRVTSGAVVGFLCAFIPNVYLPRIKKD